MTACYICSKRKSNMHTQLCCIDCAADADQTKRKARQAVYDAIFIGQIPQVRGGALECVDCGEMASEYDHRDYRKPLEVEAVCDICNKLRWMGNPYREMLSSYLPRRKRTKIVKSMLSRLASSQKHIDANS